MLSMDCIIAMMPGNHLRFLAGETFLWFACERKASLRLVIFFSKYYIAIFHAHFFSPSIKHKRRKKMFKISFTGHRPGKLPIRSYQSQIRQFLSLQLSLHPDLLVISGGALGVDQVAAEISLDLGIPYAFILPFPVDVMAARWPSSARNHLHDLISRAVHTYTVQRSFSMSGYQRRNEVMVNHCDLLCAIFDGSPGGTANCVRYAQDIGKDIHFIPL